jgi:hypothetical protein
MSQSATRIGFEEPRTAGPLKDPLRRAHIVESAMRDDDELIGLERSLVLNTTAAAFASTRGCVTIAAGSTDIAGASDRASA